MLCSATVPPDDFIANCKFPLSDLIGKAEQPLHEIWVDLEPNGKLHVKIELLWATQDEQNQPNRAFQVITKTSKDPSLIKVILKAFKAEHSMLKKHLIQTKHSGF